MSDEAVLSPVLARRGKQRGDKPRRGAWSLMAMHFLVLAATLAACHVPEESVSEEEMKYYALEVEEIVYYTDQGKLEFDYRLAEPAPGYDWISADYEGTREFDVVDWIVDPDASYFSVRSAANLVYLRDGMVLTPTTIITFDTDRDAYLFREDDHYGHSVAFAKVRMKTKSLTITWED